MNDKITTAALPNDDALPQHDDITSFDSSTDDDSEDDAAEQARFAEAAVSFTPKTSHNHTAYTPVATTADGGNVTSHNSTSASANRTSDNGLAQVIGNVDSSSSSSMDGQSRMDIASKPSLRPDHLRQHDMDRSNVAQTTPDQQKFIARKLMEQLEKELMMMSEEEEEEEEEGMSDNPLTKTSAKTTADFDDASPVTPSVKDNAAGDPCAGVQLISNGVTISKQALRMDALNDHLMQSNVRKQRKPEIINTGTTDDPDEQNRRLEESAVTHDDILQETTSPYAGFIKPSSRKSRAEDGVITIKPESVHLKKIYKPDPWLASLNKIVKFEDNSEEKTTMTTKKKSKTKPKQAEHANHKVASKHTEKLNKDAANAPNAGTKDALTGTGEKQTVNKTTTETASESKRKRKNQRRRLNLKAAKLAKKEDQDEGVA